MRLIPTEKRNDYKCCKCGRKPVKYFIQYNFTADDTNSKEYAFCNLCAVTVSQNEREHNTFLEDDYR